MSKHAVILVCFLALDVSAAPGNSLVINGDNVNVRKGPSLKYPVVVKVHKEDVVVELQRQGEWVEIEIDKTGDKTGWIHSSLVGQKTNITPEKVTARDEFQIFMAAFDELNTNIKSKMGLVYFTSAEELGYGIIQIKATDVWIDMPISEKENTMRIIFKLWDEAESSGLPIAVYIVDKNNNQHLSMYR
jgi:SH3-like domain-containing protein